MERPSHRIAALRFDTGPRRITGLGLSFLIQGLFALVLVSGFVIERAKAPPPIDLSRPADKVESAAPPPPIPTVEKPALPTVAPPIFTFDTASGASAITTLAPQTAEPPAPAPQQPKANVVPDRAAVSIAATHTSPPYPAVARRLGAEGRVTLRLTILADGKVGKAEVVTSSGRRDFDEAAQSWIVQHWTYQPAIRDGVPVASQALAAVNFTLTNP